MASGDLKGKMNYRDWLFCAVAWQKRHIAQRWNVRAYSPSQHSHLRAGRNDV